MLEKLKLHKYILRQSGKVSFVLPCIGSGGGQTQFTMQFAFASRPVVWVAYNVLVVNLYNTILPEYHVRRTHHKCSVMMDPGEMEQGS